VPTFTFEVACAGMTPETLAQSMWDIERLADFAFKQGATNGCRIKDDATGLDFRWRPVTVAQ
jgi:hypothetical protein